LALGAIGGSQFSNYSKKFQLNANYDCSLIPPGGVDSIYMIYGWNCFDYPTQLDEACFADTLVLYINLPETGLAINIEVPDSVALCDTLQFSADFDPIGEGEISNILAQINTHDSEGLNYLPNSGYLEYDNTIYFIEPSIQDSLYSWELDSIINSVQSFNGLSPNATLHFSLTTGCGISDDTMSIQLSGTNFCGQLIQELTYEWSASQITNIPLLDSLHTTVTSQMNSCSDSLAFEVTIYNDGINTSSVYNEFEIVLPNGFSYLSGWNPISSNGDTLIFSIDSYIASNDSVSFVFYTSSPSILCGQYNTYSSLHLNSPYYCDTNLCFYSQDLNFTDTIETTVFNGMFSIENFDPTLYCFEDSSTVNISYEGNLDGDLTVLNYNSGAILSTNTIVNTGIGTNNLTIQLSDTASTLAFVVNSCVCIDILFFNINCDSVCYSDASFNLENYCLGDTINIYSNSPQGSNSEWVYNYFNLTQTGDSVSFPAAQSLTF
jgi:hypothetical protein